MGNLPKEGVSQEIGRLAGDALGVKRPRSWISKEQDGDTDFGIDYLVQLKSNESYVSYSFYLQLKGTTVPSYSADKSHISYDFKVETLNYYYQQEPLVMVAVVDLEGNENKLWECPIYYFWLDDEWFENHKGKLETNKTISVKIPTAQLLEQSLDIYEYYAERIRNKLTLNQLQRTIQTQSKDADKSIKLISKTISEKPILLQSLEEQCDTPWLQNPDGAIATELKKCSDYLVSNKLLLAKKILDGLDERVDEFTPNEKAELYYQEGNLLTLEGKYDLAEAKHKLASNFDIKDRYKLGYIESRFKLDNIPSPEELTKIADEIDTSTYHNCIVKAKCLALVDKENEAFDLLKSKYPEKLVGQMMILTIAGKLEELEQLISENRETEFPNERETFIFNAMCARRLFFKASNEKFVKDEVLPLQGKKEYDLLCMKDALFFATRAWVAAKHLGYPGDLGILIDVSSLIYGYFNKIEELFEHFEAMLSERPNHSELIRCYSRLLFNIGDYSKVIELVDRLAKLDSDDCGLLILSYYHKKKPSKTLDLVQKHENLLLESTNHNAPMIFCVAAEIADEQLDSELASKYEDIVRSYNDGEALIAIREFVNLSNQHPDKRQEYAENLYERYRELEESLVIAEQLFRYLSAYETSSAIKLIELGQLLIKTRELTPDDCLHLAQAFLTSENWREAEDIAVKNIEKGIDIPNWEIIKAASLQHQGKIGAAFDAVKTAIEAENVTKDQLSYYVNLCLKLGLFNDAVSIIKELLTKTNEPSEKIYLLQTLIAVYSSNSENPEQLKQAIDRYGSIVDQDNCDDEGRFLLYFLMSPKHENNDEKVKEFQTRLASYTKKFPDSAILKQAFIDPDGGADSIIETMNKISGVTKEQVQKWEHNKKSIRNGSLPVPFCMLENFLSDTRDIYTSWAMSLHSSEDTLEYKICHSPQLDKIKFLDCLSDGKLILEETSLLILNELKILDKLLAATTQFSLLNSVYDKLSRSTHPIAGSIHNLIPAEIIDQINRYIHKLILINDDEEENIFESYSNALKDSDAFLLTDDLYMYQFLTIDNNKLISGNSFNVIEYLCQKKLISEDEYFNLISKFCELGVFQPNMRMDVLCSTVCYYLNAKNVVDYNETKFKPIFNKLFDSNRNSAYAIELFFRMLVQSSNEMAINAKTLLSLFRGILFRHQFKDLKSFIALWFVFMNIYTKPFIESALLSTSRKNVELWLLYKELMLSVNSKELANKKLVHLLVVQLSAVQNDVLGIAYNHIKSCFIPMTEEARIFESMYQELSVLRKLENLKARK